MKKKRIVLFAPRSQTPTLRTVPLSLLAIASALEAEGQYDIRIVAADTDRDYLSNVVELAENSICVGITCMTGPHIENALEVARAVKARYPKTPIVWGGWHPSICPEQTVAHSYVDIVVRGQGERTFQDLVHSLEGCLSLDTVLGITYKTDGKILRNPDRPFEDINGFPRYPYHLIDMESYIRPTDLGSRTTAYVSSYGCPYRCAFCADSLVNKRRWSGLEGQRVAGDLQYLVRSHHVDSIAFMDSNFFVDEERVKEICRGIIDKGLGIKWGADARADRLTRYKEETWELMRKSGCEVLGVGAESGSQAVLDFIQKDERVEDTLKLAETARKYEMRIRFTFMMGFPHVAGRFTMSADDQFEKTADLMDRIFSISYDHIANWLIYTPYPGTPLYDASVKAGLKEPSSLEEWSGFDLYKYRSPWLLDKYVDIIQRLDNFILPFCSNFILHVSKNKFKNRSILTQYLIELIVRILQKSARFRWKQRFFSFPVEERAITHFSKSLS